MNVPNSLLPKVASEVFLPSNREDESVFSNLPKWRQNLNKLLLVVVLVVMLVGGTLLVIRSFNWVVRG